MGLLLDLLADDFPDLAIEPDRARRDAALLAAVQDATTVVDTARTLVTVYDDGARSVHPGAALTVPGLLAEIDRLTAQLNAGADVDALTRDERDHREAQLAARADNPQPTRGDRFETWLKAQRDEYHQTTGPQWQALDEALDTYRLHADTGVPLDQHACEGRCGDCASGGTR